MPIGSLQGTFRPPGDKSVSHRVALFSLLAEGCCRVEGFSDCADCASSLSAVVHLGGGVKELSGALELRGAGGRLVRWSEIDCGNSGTTMRLLQGILAGRLGQFHLDGDDSLRRRPMERVAVPLRLMGAEVRTTDGHAPLEIKGAPLRGIRYDLPVASAQLKTALLLAGLQADAPSRIREPAPSRDHSERLLRAWGADLEEDEGGLVIFPGSLRMVPTFTVPGDASGAAFFLCGAAICPDSAVLASEVMLNPTRIGWVEILRRMGAGVVCSVDAEIPEPMGRMGVSYSEDLHGCEIAAEAIPNIVDEVPILALVATQARGTTIFRDAGELRVKECDRLVAIQREWTRLGADVRIEGDDLIVVGPTALRAPAEPCESYGDHRIAMALRIASLLCEGELRIRDEACAAVSYPGFAAAFEHLTEGDAA